MIRDVSHRWTPTPDRSTPLVERDGLSVRWVNGLSQTLISGDLQAARAAFGITSPEVGLSGIAGSEALVRLARDRALLVSEEGEPGIAPGWHSRGFAITPMNDAWTVLDIAGAQATHLVAQGAAVDWAKANASRTAALLFAGCWAILYRRSEDTARIHIERSLAPYLAKWIRPL